MARSHRNETIIQVKLFVVFLLLAIVSSLHVDNQNRLLTISRRNFGKAMVLFPSVAIVAPSTALVKGSAPPVNKVKSERGSCKNIDECEQVGKIRTDELFADIEDDSSVQLTSRGDRFKDIVIGTGKEQVDQGSKVLRCLSSLTNFQLTSYLNR